MTNHDSVKVQIGEFTPACCGARQFLSGSVPPWQHAVHTSARRSVMMGQQQVFVHRNRVIDCYITVVPVESGWLLLKEIRVWGKLQNWVSSGMFFFFLFPETRSSQKSFKFLVIFKTCLCFFVFCFCRASPSVPF